MWNYLALQNDPYSTVSLLSEEEKETARKQTISSLQDLLKFAKQHNTSVIFDLKNKETEEIDTHDTVEKILEFGIPQSLVSLLTCINCGIQAFHNQAYFEEFSFSFS